MNKIKIGLLMLLLALPLAAQEKDLRIQHEAVAVNIEIPVRVYKGESFIKDLTMDDFLIYEDGVLQKIDAVYLIQKTDIERKEEESKAFFPQVSRNFVLLFEIQEYLPRVGEAIDYFFKNVILSGDTLTAVTPMRSYNFKKEALEKMPKEVIAGQLKDTLRKDATVGNAEYRNTVQDLKNFMMQVFGGGGGGADFDLQFDILREYMQKLENLRRIDQGKIDQFAKYLKDQPGQKHVFLFYQKELLPTVDPRVYTLLMSNTQQEDQPKEFTLMEIFDYYRRDVAFNVDEIKKSFSDSSISIHFLYVTQAADHNIDPTAMGSLANTGLVMKEQSEDIYSAFREIAAATGGISESSMNAESAFQKAVAASENYYLLYYTPGNYRPDGSFKKIEVKVRSGRYRISHRSGYFAN
ncbi:MAG: VWA domain-containing protein [Acidobacteriota bacterium]